MAQADDKTQLIADLARARAQISGQVVALRHDLDFPTRAKAAFKRGPLPWLGGAAVVGLILSRLPGRKKTVVVPSRKGSQAEAAVETAGKYGLLLGALKVAFNLARPALTAWVARQVSEYANRGFRPTPTSRP